MGMFGIFLGKHPTKMLQKKFHKRCKNNVFVGLLTFWEGYERSDNFEWTFYCLIK